MPKLIQDEFTSLPISPQRRRQLRCERDGLCRTCGQPADAPYCPTCREKQRVANGSKVATVRTISATAYL